MLAILKNIDTGFSWIIVAVLVLGSFFQGLNNGIINFKSAGSLLAILAFICLSYKEGAKRYLKDLENVVNPRKESFFCVLFTVSFVYLLFLPFYTVRPSYVVYARSISILVVISIIASCVYMLTTNQFKVNKRVIFIGKTSGVIYPGGVISINLLKPESFEVISERFDLEPFTVMKEGIRFLVSARAHIDIDQFMSVAVRNIDVVWFKEVISRKAFLDTENIFSRHKELTITKEMIHDLQNVELKVTFTGAGDVTVYVNRKIEF